MTKNQRTTSGSEQVTAGGSASNIPSRWPTGSAKAGGKSRKLRSRSPGNSKPVQLSLDLEAVTGLVVVECPPSVVELPNSEIIEQEIPETVTLQQTGVTLQQTPKTPKTPLLPDHLPPLPDPVIESLYPSGVPANQSPATNCDKPIDVCPKRDRAKGWLVWRIQYHDCSGKQRSRVVKLGQPVPENSYGPYAHYCWYRPGMREGEKYLGKSDSPNYKKFLAAWDECSSVDEILARIFGSVK